MPPQRRTRLGLRDFLHDLKKADPLFWITALIAIAFLIYLWLCPSSPRP